VRASPFPAADMGLFENPDRHTRRPARSLLFVDDYDAGSSSFRSALWAHLRNNRNQDLLICSGLKAPRELQEPLVIDLGGLSQADVYALIRRRLMVAGANEAQTDKLYDLLSNSALRALGKTPIREHLRALREFAQGLQVYSHPGILDPSGKPLVQVPDPVKLIIVDTNRILLERLRANPEELYSLDPLAFEELVADMLRERGYEITLTPATNDGGFDMFAAWKDDLGSFLYLVECKRYTPPNKVGVSIVRSLHGVVQQQQANAGIVVTTSFFTKGAREFQEDSPHQMHLRDFLSLQEWLGVPRIKRIPRT